MNKTPANMLDNMQTYKTAVIQQHGVQIQIRVSLSKHTVFKGAQSANVNVPARFQDAIQKLKKKCEALLCGNDSNAVSFLVTVPKKHNKHISARYKGKLLKEYKCAREECLYFCCRGSCLDTWDAFRAVERPWTAAISAQSRTEASTWQNKTWAL